MKLELKHLAPYLPYGLEIKWFRKEDNSFQTSTLTISDYPFLIKQLFKPILRPLSDLLNDEDSFDHIFIKETDYESIQEWIGLDTESQKTCKFSLEFWNNLFKNHFDVFGLIPQGLAIDINTL